MKLFDLVEVEEDDEVLPNFVEVEEEDEEEDKEVFSGVEDLSSRVPHVSVALSSTSWTERDTDGLRVVSPGS